MKDRILLAVSGSLMVVARSGPTCLSADRHKDSKQTNCCYPVGKWLEVDDQSRKKLNPF
jgi:hypothetical protein